MSTQKINGLASEEFLSKISTKFAKKILEKLKQLECESIDIKKLLNNVFQGPVKFFGTKQEIFQDVKFGQELLEVNQLLVMERINNVLFVGGVAQVLRKRLS